MAQLARRLLTKITVVKFVDFFSSMPFWFQLSRKFEKQHFSATSEKCFLCVSLGSRAPGWTCNINAFVFFFGFDFFEPKSDWWFADDGFRLCNRRNNWPHQYGIMEKHGDKSTLISLSVRFKFFFFFSLLFKLCQPARIPPAAISGRLMNHNT